MMNKQEALSIYQKMFLIRHAEETIAEKYPEGKMRCPTHLSIGQEAVPAVVGTLTTKDDLAVSTHRCHAHYLGKGGSLNAMIAELHGKVTGCSRGKGGSMHLIDESVGFMASTAIVANSIPVGVGLGFSLKLKKTPNVSVVFLGDGAIEEGAFYEAANFAALKKIPVLFVCENNLYSVYSPLRVRQPDGRKISELVNAIGIQVTEGDGNDAEECFDLISAAKERALGGQGPQFVELFTYRWREHCGPFYDNHLGYRTEEEFEEWKNRDPLPRFKQKILERNWHSEIDLKEIETKTFADIEFAFKFAEESPFPEAKETFSPIFKPKTRVNEQRISNESRPDLCTSH